MPHPAEEPAPLAPLLGPEDPPPIELLETGPSGVALLVADHAGRAIPRRLRQLGLPPAALDLHIAYDIGIAELTRALGARLDAAGVMSRYSRLVIDCNRRLEDPTSIAQESDGIEVPGNRGLAPAERRRRAGAIFAPYHAAIAALLARRRQQGRPTVLVSMHSFTPRIDGVERPWHIGVLWDKDPRLARPLLERLRAERDLVVGDNEPYDARDGVGFTVEAHAVPVGLPHLMLEIRQDLIAEPAAAERFADRLAPILAPLVDAAVGR
jgi:predicted N-formylglutamate amidohydrolase